ncbi:response regulator [Kordiimonas laminariae]|uniref:response regulator n=1 Tax=Kordiimonas laminariae TaxID=2917717 RepID=UPI001FF6866A|nr:response regulator [Kordiimonas laminariae]MCK0070318.1 response regulator [Kordiimonas laminariae]
MDNGEKHILYVEDIEVNQLIIKSMISRMSGYQIECAETGVEALKMLADKDYDLVLTDLFLPDMNGFDLYEKFLNKEPESTIPFIALTSDISDESRERANNLSFKGYLEKPVRPDDLENMLKAAFAEDLPV